MAPGKGPGPPLLGSFIVNNINFLTIAGWPDAKKSAAIDCTAG